MYLILIQSLGIVGVCCLAYYSYKIYNQSSDAPQPNEDRTTSNTANANESVEPKAGMSQPSSSSTNINYDALHEDESDNELDIHSHKSLVRHMLSQVSIGMDLSKIVLPTFILERRSLLEMYADFFSHPELFIKIPELQDPKNRMLQVIRWYLSSFHVGRKSQSAKKPYNPILGETFLCFWDMNIDSSKSNFVKNGPVPWCRKDQISFIAEQVSHHPPISALYAEHVDKRITFNAHIYTKSKFLGLSICVYNIGKGVLYVMDHEEEYIVTFPNGYGRSILTVPWVELGGDVTIKCPKTGFYSTIHFLLKPFYNDKRYKIQGEVFSPDDNKPFLKIFGEWNGLMTAKYSSDEIEEFLDVTKLKVTKKQVRPIGQQQENESRRLWRKVTAGLSLNDLEVASKEKQKLEVKQRLEEKERIANKISWQTKHFFKNENGEWIYIKPLHERLKEKSKKRESS